jgi:hypothetical protein
MKSSVCTEGNDTPTPKTDALIEEMLCGDGIPRCKEWERLEAHAREMERMAHAYRAVAVAGMRITSTR